VAAWGGIKLLREDFDCEPQIVTGPATDNLIGKELIVEKFGIPAVNAITHGVELGDVVADLLDLRKSSEQY
jgi:hypothetical protein